MKHITAHTELRMAIYQVGKKENPRTISDKIVNALKNYDINKYEFESFIITFYKYCVRRNVNIPENVYQTLESYIK